MREWLVEVEAEVETEAKPEAVIRCRECGHQVARAADQKADEHTFRNPAGYSFHVVCFERAAGCRSCGAAEERDSWFQGFAWTVAVCERCEQHLGWEFSHPEMAGFHGLIATRLSGLR